MSVTNSPEKTADIRAAVRQHYGEAAASFKPKSACGCGSKDSGMGELNAAKLYTSADLETLPEDVTGL